MDIKVSGDYEVVRGGGGVGKKGCKLVEECSERLCVL